MPRLNFSVVLLLCAPAVFAQVYKCIKTGPVKSPKICNSNLSPVITLTRPVMLRVAAVAIVGPVINAAERTGNMMNRG
jgi:hypothetical protein